MMLYKKKLESIMPATGIKSLISSGLIGQNSSPRQKGPIESVLKLKKGGLMTYLRVRF